MLTKKNYVPLSFTECPESVTISEVEQVVQDESIGTYYL